MGCPYEAVGMQRALDSAIGLPNRSTSALWMLVFLMPADVRRSFKMSLLVVVRSHARTLKSGNASAIESEIVALVDGQSTTSH